MGDDYILNENNLNSQNDFILLYEQNKKLMYSIAIGILNSEFDAEDAVQNAAVQIFYNLDKFHDFDSNITKRLIVIITKNATIDIYRKRKKQWATEAEMNDTLNNTLGYTATFSEDEDSFMALIQNIPDKYRDVLFLKYVSELKNEEISEILNISVLNTRQRLSRAKKILRTQLRKEDLL